MDGSATGASLLSTRTGAAPGGVDRRHSLDEADPPEAWPWCGPRWTGSIPDTSGAPISGITVTAADPEAAAARWAAILDRPPDGSVIALPGTTIDFAPADDRPDRLAAVRIPGMPERTIGGVRLHG